MSSQPVKAKEDNKREAKIYFVFILSS